MLPQYKTLIIAWVVVAVWIGFVIAMNRKQHPKALFYLFMVELWERFSYYGMRAFLVFFLTKALVTGGFGFEEKVGYAVYAAYGAMVYLTPLAGGYLADKLLGFRRAIVWGAILMAAGQFVLSTSTGTTHIAYTEYKARLDAGETADALAAGRIVEPGSEMLLFAGLALLVIGNGFFKPNISSLVGKFYGPGDPRRDGAFTIFYMGINMGAFLAPLTCGTVAELEGWKYGFMLAGAGMITGLLIFLYTTTTGVLGTYADAPMKADGRGAGFTKLLPVYLGTLVAVPLVALLIQPSDLIEKLFVGTALEQYQLALMDFLLAVVGLSAIGYMLYLSFQYPVAERQRIWVIVVLLLFTTVFWTFFELAGSALNLFTDKNVNKNLLGQDIPASAFQSANALFIMIFAPLFSIMWVWLAKRNLDPSAGVKFAIGLLLLGAGFLILNLGKAAAVEGIVPAMFLILLYLMHTLGELALSPVGLSLVTKLAPAQMVGFMMGFWFLSSAIAHQAGKFIASETAAPKNATPQETLELYMKVFNDVGIMAIGSGVLLLLLSPLIKKWMHGVK